MNATNATETFLLQNGSLGGQQDKTGKVIFKASAPSSKLSHIIEGNPLIGESRDKRAKEFTVEVSNGNVAHLIGDIFAAKLHLRNGSVTANANIDVGADGETIASSYEPVQLTLSSGQQPKERTVNLGQLQVNNSLIINAHDKLSLNADMTNSKNSVAINAQEGTTTKRGDWKGDIQLTAASSNLVLEDGYVLKGNINRTTAALNHDFNDLMANNAIVKGNIGKAAHPLTNLVINDDKTFTVEGEVYLTGETKLNENSKLIIGDNYRTSRIHARSENAEIIFNNKKPLKFTTTPRGNMQYQDEMTLEKLLV